MVGSDRPANSLAQLHGNCLPTTQLLCQHRLRPALQNREKTLISKKPV